MIEYKGYRIETIDESFMVILLEENGVYSLWREFPSLGACKVFIDSLEAK